MTTNSREDPTPYIEALSHSYKRLCELVVGADLATLTSPSGCSEWTIAQLLSHLGSGAEIFSANLDGFVDDGVLPTMERYEAIWAQWDALDPLAQARRWHEEDGSLIERLCNGRGELDGFEATLFGFYPADGAGFVRLRLGEHALHLLDVEVTAERHASILPDAVELLVTHFAHLAPFLARVGEGEGAMRPPTLVVDTYEPSRRFRFAVTDRLVVEASPGAPPDLTIPAEALIRVITGRTRLGAPIEHTAMLEALSSLFPGF